MPERTIRETRILAEDEIIDISVKQVSISFDNAHTIKGHNKRDHRHTSENEAQEIDFNSPKKLIEEIMSFIDANRRIIDEIKRR